MELSSSEAYLPISLDDELDSQMRIIPQERGSWGRIRTRLVAFGVGEEVGGCPFNDGG